MASFHFMIMKIVTIILLILNLCTTISNGANKKESRKQTLNTEEDMELTSQLNILNKPPIMSYNDTNGGIIDCIDISKQPAFDHPLLKDHKLQRKPSYVPKEVRLRGGSRLIGHASQRNFQGCPYGSVPFRRTTKEDLIRAKRSLINLHRSRPIDQALSEAPNPHHAIVSTLPSPSLKIYGAAVSISVYNLTDEPPQISETQLWIGSIVQGPYNSLEYGWTVNPGLYGDSQSRTYSLWTADGFQNTGCYNALCPGYVQVSQNRIMGEVDHPVTVPGDDVYAMEFKIFRDPNTSNWWLFENLGGKTDEPVGYWPKELFPLMSESAAVVQIGGKVSSPLPKPTPMGSGAFVEDDFTRTCYASNIELVDSNYQFYTPGDVQMEVLADVPDTYKAVYLGDASKDHPDRGYTLLFGGPADSIK